MCGSYICKALSCGMTSVITVNTIKELRVGRREPHRGREEGSCEESVPTNLERLRNIQGLLLVAGGLFACLPVDSPHSAQLCHPARAVAALAGWQSHPGSQ